jgi:hypothetical protein
LNVEKGRRGLLKNTMLVTYHKALRAAEPGLYQWLLKVLRLVVCLVFI